MFYVSGCLCNCAVSDCTFPGGKYHVCGVPRSPSQCARMEQPLRSRKNIWREHRKLCTLA